eukprot:5676438-Prymnesium_polylepis.1
MELLVDTAIMDGDKYWTALRNMRSVSKAFYDVVNAKLDALLAELKTKADAARREFELVAKEYPHGATHTGWRFGWGRTYSKPDWVKCVQNMRSSDPAKYIAYAAYNDVTHG